MTLTTDDNRISHIANGVTAAFPYDFLVLSAAEMLVYVNDVLLPGSGYTVSNLGLGSGGNVTLAAIPVTGTRVDLIRSTDQTQQVNFQEGDKLPSEQLEGALDKAYAAIQDVQEQVTRAVKVPPTTAAGVPGEPTMPPLDELAGQVLQVNAEGTGIEGVTLTSVDMVSPITTQGDLLRGGTSGVPERLALGTPGYLLSSVSNQVQWVAPTTVAIPGSILLAKGDLIVATAPNVPDRKALGSSGGVLTTDASTADGLNWALGAALHGRVRLAVGGATVLTLSPYNGNTVYVKDASGWRIRGLPSVGVTAINTSTLIDGAGGSLAADTTYLVTLADNGGTLVLDFRTTLTHETDLDFGAEIATGLPTRTVVGLIHTSGTGEFLDIPGWRGVLNWFNRMPRFTTAAFTTNRTVASLPFVEVHTEIRTLFLTWLDAAVLLSVTGSRALTSGEVTTGLAINSITTPSAVTASNSTLAPVALTWTGQLAQGWHFATVLAATSTAVNVATYHGTNDAGDTGQVRIFGLVQG